MDVLTMAVLPMAVLAMPILTMAVLTMAVLTMAALLCLSYYGCGALQAGLRRHSADGARRE